VPIWKGIPASRHPGIPAREAHSSAGRYAVVVFVSQGECTPDRQVSMRPDRCLLPLNLVSLRAG